MQDSWLEVAIEIPNESAELVAEFLSEISGSGVCVENLNVDAFSISEISHKSVTTLKAYFSEDNEIEKQIKKITFFLEKLALSDPTFRPPKPVVSKVYSEDWSNSWKINFKPLRVGKRLLIVPSWEEAEITDNDIVLNLDPGMAFGTGGHETTRLCLELLEEILSERKADAPAALLDLGTGSGILAMAASKLGAKPVYAVDIDPEAVTVALENIEINNLSVEIKCNTTRLEDIKQSFDIILANILAEELVRLAAELTRRMTEDGVLVLSGILADKEEFVRKGFAAEPLKYIKTVYQGEWVAMLYQRRFEA